MHPSGTVDEARRLLGAGLCRPDGSFGLPYWHCTNEQCNRRYPSGRYEWFEAIRLADRQKEMRAKFIWDPEGGPCCNDKILEACIFCANPKNEQLIEAIQSLL